MGGIWGRHAAGTVSAKQGFVNPKGLHHSKEIIHASFRPPCFVYCVDGRYGWAGKPAMETSDGYVATRPVGLILGNTSDGATKMKRLGSIPADPDTSTCKRQTAEHAQ